jgi:hypothetical protein
MATFVEVLPQGGHDCALGLQVQKVFGPDDALHGILIPLCCLSYLAFFLKQETECLLQ